SPGSLELQRGCAGSAAQLMTLLPPVERPLSRREEIEWRTRCPIVRDAKLEARLRGLRQRRRSHARAAPSDARTSRSPSDRSVLRKPKAQSAPSVPSALFHAPPPTRPSACRPPCLKC